LLKLDKPPLIEETPTHTQIPQTPETEDKNSGPGK
jgi:hypothetical protein